MTPKYLDALAELGGGHDTIDDVIARLDVGLFVDHVEEGCIYASPEVLRMFEMSWEEFRGFGWAKAVLPADVERLRTAIERYEIEKDTIEVEYSIRVADGSVRTIHVFGNAVLDREGRQLGSVMIGREVTAERAVLDRASQQQKLEVIGRLAGRVAHDFNNVLVPIMCSASLLKSEALSSSGREMLDTLEASAQHAAAITRQLLSLSRQTVHEHQLTVVDVELAEKTRLLRQLVGEQIALDVVLECGFAEVSLAPHELSQVVLNLVVNARDVSKPGDTVRVETWLDEGVAGIRVRDRGPGIDPDILPQIFDPFYSTKGPGSGLGLGLSISFNIIRDFGGALAASNHGDGAEFSITLRRSDARPNAAPEAAE